MQASGSYDLRGTASLCCFGVATEPKALGARASSTFPTTRTSQEHAGPSN